MYVCMYVCIYIYIYIERERERERDVYTHVYTYILCLLIVAIFNPFSQFCEIHFPPEPAKTAKHSPTSISEGGRIWQVCYYYHYYYYYY